MASKTATAAAAAVAAVLGGLGGQQYGADQVQALWDADRAAQLAAGKPDPQDIADTQPDEYLTQYLDLKDGTGPHKVRTKGRKAWAEAGLHLGIATKVCGNDQQTPSACPEIPAKDLCALCPPEWHLSPYPSLETEDGGCGGRPELDGGRCQYPCNAGSYEVPGRGCETLTGRSCYQGTWKDTGEACDPRAAPCEPWPCELTSGDVPELQVVTERKSAKLELRPWADKLLVEEVP